MIDAIRIVAFGVAVSVTGLVLMTVWDCLDAKLTRWRAAREAALVDDCCCKRRPADITVSDEQYSRYLARRGL